MGLRHLICDFAPSPTSNLLGQTGHFGGVPPAGFAHSRVSFTSVSQAVSENGWKRGLSMSTALVDGLEQSTPARYEALMRISNCIRARTESEDLFDILVRELGNVIQFDAIAQF